MVMASSLGAQDSTKVDPRAVQPERPTVATHAHTVAPGYVEIETGVEGDRAGDARDWFAPTLVKVGLASHVQLDLNVPVVFVGSAQASGIGDVGIGVKWRLLDGNPVLGDFAVQPSVKFSSGSETAGTGTGTTDLTVLAISSHVIGGVSLDLNAGYTRVGASATSGATSSALWTVSFGIPVAGRLSWALEVFGNPTVDGSGAPSRVAVLTGPTYLVARSFNVDLGVIAPVRGGVVNAVYAGLVWNLGSFSRER